MALAHLHDATLEMGWGGNNNVLWHATLKKYDATLAHVVHVREHNCDVSFIKNMLHYIATLAHAVKCGNTSLMLRS